MKADRLLIARLAEEAVRYTTPIHHFMRSAIADGHIKRRSITIVTERSAIPSPFTQSEVNAADRFSWRRSSSSLQKQRSRHAIVSIRP